MLVSTNNIDENIWTSHTRALADFTISSIEKLYNSHDLIMYGDTSKKEFRSMINE